MRTARMSGQSTKYRDASELSSYYWRYYTILLSTQLLSHDYQYHYHLITNLLLSFKHARNQSYGAITTLFNTPVGKSSSPRTVVCAHGFKPFSLRIVFAKHDDHLFRGYAFTTSWMVSLCTSCSRIGGVMLSMVTRQRHILTSSHPHPQIASSKQTTT